MRFGILGSGFGIYGYSKAIFELGHSIILPSRYREIMRERNLEISQSDLLTYVDSNNEILAICESLVVANTPEFQSCFLMENLSSKLKFFVEKPLASNIDKHRNIFEIATNNSCDISIAYLFQYASWWKSVIDEIQKGSTGALFFNWEVKRPDRSWKSQESMGGGLASFYGIHFAPLFATFPGGSLSNLKNKDSEIDLNLIYSYHFTKTIEIRIRYSDRNCFQILAPLSNSLLYSDETPFGKTPNPKLRDPRVDVLKSYIESELSDRQLLSFYDIEKFAILIRECGLVR